MKNKKLKIVVTGSHGYIGSEIVFRLKMLGFNCIELDLKIDKDIVKDMPTCDVVVHCASRLDDNKDVVEYNTKITKKVLQKAKRIVFLSSAAVYGNVIRPVKEDGKLAPINNYGESKVLCEKMIAQSKKPYTIFRLSNVYSMFAFHGVIADWENNEVINGDGKQVRDFVRLEDIVPVIVEAAISSKWKGVYNLSTGKGIQILDLFKRLYPKSEIVYDKKAINEIRSSILNSKKAQKKGFKPL